MIPLALCTFQRAWQSVQRIKKTTRHTEKEVVITLEKQQQN